MKKKLTAKFESCTDGNRDPGCPIHADDVPLRPLRKCRCREPKQHTDCMYCGCGYWGEVICGVCKEQGIDGKLIRGTGRIVCAAHKKLVREGCTCHLLPEYDMDGSRFEGCCNWCRKNVQSQMRDASINHEGPIG